MLVFRPCHAYQRLPAACRLLSTYRSAPSPAAKLRGSTAAPPPTRGRQRQLRAMAASATAAPTDWAADGDYPATLLQALAVPPGPGFRPLGARVEHLLAPRQGRVAQLVGEALSLPEGAAELLLRFGAIHACPVPPPTPATVLEGLPPEEAQRLLDRRAEALRRAGNSSQARTPQRVTADVEVPPHSYIRVHLHPKRFPAAHAVDWGARVVAQTPDFVVVSKPAGVPAAPTVDNLLECAPGCAAQAVGHPVPLLVTHRLDQCTEGLLVLGKTKAFVAAFNELVKRSGGSAGPGLSSEPASRCSSGSGSSNGDDGRTGSSDLGGGGGSGGSAPRPLRKFYRAATAAPPPLGLLRHHLSIERRQAGLPCCTIAHDAAVEGSLPAELRVLEVQPIRLSAGAAAAWGLPPGAPAHECLLELLTGRTHQVRAQLSAAGCPLLGDLLYQPLASPELRQRLFAGDPCDDLRQGGRLLSEPGGGIGLQACRLEVADACMGGSAEQPAVFEAGTPWWRDADA